MSLELTDLLSLPFGIPMDELSVRFTNSFGHYHKIADHIYIHTLLVEMEGASIFYGFAWVTSDATAKTLFTREWIADDGIRLEPPSVLLPKGKIMRYGEIKVYGQQVDAKHFGDSVGRQRRVRSGDFNFYYRGSFPDSDALPIGIEVDRQDLMIAG